MSGNRKKKQAQIKAKQAVNWSQARVIRKQPTVTAACPEPVLLPDPALLQLEKFLSLGHIDTQQRFLAHLALMATAEVEKIKLGQKAGPI